MFIAHDTNKTVHDDYVLNVQPHLDRDKYKESVEIKRIVNGTHVCIGWKIQNKYE